MFEVKDRRIIISRGDTALLTIVSTGRVLTMYDAVLLTVSHKRYGTIVQSIQIPDNEGKTYFAFMNQETCKWYPAEYDWDIRVVLDAIIDGDEIIGGRDVTTPFSGDKFIVRNTVGDVCLTNEETSEGINGATLSVEIEDQEGEVAMRMSTLSSDVPTVDWMNILNKPNTYPPSAHTHSAAQVGADPAGSAVSAASSAVSSHNRDQNAHADMRKQLSELSSKKITAPKTASVGQMLVVKAVDASGAPIDWETKTPSAGGNTGGDSNSAPDGGNVDVSAAIEAYLNQNSQDIAVLTINLGGTIYTYNGSTAVTITIEDGDSKAY